MMRSLWTAASGMIAQQTNVDTISNNLANVNTTGYKKERLEFKTLLYQTMQRTNLDPANGTGRPVNLQVGLGVRPVATTRLFDQGNMEMTMNKLDFAIEGEGMFVVRDNERLVYMKDGALKLSIVDEGRMITTADGLPVLNTDLEPIYLPDDVELAAINVSFEGVISYTDAEGIINETGSTIALVQFPNYQGLETLGSNTYGQTIASGDPIYEFEGTVMKRSKLIQGYLEMSNVQVAEEMVKLIVAQRAYELNSKAITTSDDMLQIANNLKR